MVKRTKSTNTIMKSTWNVI